MGGGRLPGLRAGDEFVNVSAGYRVNNYFRIHATATNLFDQKRFQLYGGSVIGRRVLGGSRRTSERHPPGTVTLSEAKGARLRACPLHFAQGDRLAVRAEEAGRPSVEQTPQPRSP